jgi:uncharacterized protein (TIGR02001 family)
MKKIILSAAVFAAFASSSAMAQEAASPHTFTGNVALTSDYRFRGLSQSYEDPAIQGGFDYAHSSGFYVGNWNSSVSQRVIGNDAGNSGTIEMDFYGGYKFEPVAGLAGDVGILQYYYPGAEDFNTTELYAGASWQWLSAKYSYAVSDKVFGVDDADGSWYLDLNANFEVAEKTILNLHVGRQKIKNSDFDADYTDWKIGVSRDFGFATLGLAYIDTNASDFYELGGKQIGDSTVVFTVSKTF